MYPRPHGKPRKAAPVGRAARGGRGASAAGHWQVTTAPSGLCVFWAQTLFLNEDCSLFLNEDCSLFLNEDCRIEENRLGKLHYHFDDIQVCLSRFSLNLNRLIREIKY